MLVFLKSIFAVFPTTYHSPPDLTLCQLVQRADPRSCRTDSFLEKEESFRSDLSGLASLQVQKVSPALIARAEREVG